MLKTLKVASGILLLFSFFGCFVSQKDRSFKLIGLMRSKAAKNIDTIILSYIGASEGQRIDTVLTNKNKFVFKGSLEAPVLAVVSTGKLSYDWDDVNTFHLFLEPKKIKVMFERGNINNAIASGSKTQDQFKFMEAKTLIIEDELNHMIAKRNELSEAYKTENLTSIKYILDSINSIQIKKLQEIQDIRLRFVEQNPRSYLSAYFLNFYKKEVELEYLRTQYNNLKSDIKKSFFASQILEYLNRLENVKPIKIDDKLPSFYLKDINGANVALNRYIGKKTLIIFWASWCAPCRKETPYLKMLHEKYAPMGLQMLGISLDEDLSDWRQAIRTDGPQWPQLVESNGFNSTFIGKLNIKAVPEYMLIDVDGRLIAKGFALDRMENLLDNFLRK